MNFDTKQLERKWSNAVRVIESVKGKMSPEMKNTVLHSLENTGRMLAFKESTQPGNIGQYKKYAIDIVSATVPNLIAFDLVGVQPMDNKSGMVNYINYNYSNTKGAVKAGDTFNSSLNMGPSNPYYSADLVKDHAVTLDANGSAVLDWAPVMVDTLTVVKADGTKGMTTPGSFGKIDGDVKGTVEPAGLLTIEGGAEGDVVTVTYRFANNVVKADGPAQAGFTDAPAAELEIKSVPVNAKTRTLRAFWAFDAAYELSKEYGMDIESLLATQICGEISHEIDQEIVKGMYDFANAAPISTWSRTPDIGVSRWEHYNGFAITLQENAASIFQATQKYGANFIVCGTQVAVVVKALNGFESAGNGTVAGPHFIGTVDGMKVYVDPSLDATAYVLGFKGNNAMEAGIFYCPYMPVSSTDLIVDANYRGQRGWATSYGTAFINDKLYAKGNIL